MNLRAVLEQFHPQKQREVFGFSLLEDGIPKGAITEISGALGSGKTESVLTLISENRDAQVAWIEDEVTVYPCAFLEHGIDLSRVLFVEGGKDSIWILQQVLKSQLFQIVVFSGMDRLKLSERELRRLQLASEKSETALVLLNEQPLGERAWPVAVQLFARRDLFSFRSTLQILKYRGQKSWKQNVG